MKKALPLFLVSLLLLMFSCKEDDLEPNTKDINPQVFNRSIVSYQDMRIKVSTILSQPFNLFNNVASRGGVDYIQEIDTTYIIEYSNDTLSTYTMRVVTLDEENYSYSNLIIKTLNGETEELIAHYRPTPEWQSAHDNGEYLPFDGELVVTDIRGESFDIQGRVKFICTYAVLPIWQCDAGNPHPPGFPGCSEGGSEIIGYTFDIDCRSTDGSGGGGGDDDPYDPFDDNGQGNLPTDPISGGGSGNNNNNDTPCHSLRNKLNEPMVNNKSFKTRLEELKNTFNNSGGYEYGFINQNPKDEGGTNTQTNQYNPTVSTGPHKTKSPFLSKRQTFGYAHSHPIGENSAGIHSFPDLKIFLQMVFRRFNAGLSTSDTYGIVVGEHGVYALKVNNITTFATFFLGATNQEKAQFWEIFKKQYDKLITNGTDNTRTGNEESMTKLLKKFNDKLGIGLYRAKDDLTGWNQLQLGVHGSGVLSIPCN